LNVEKVQAKCNQTDKIYRVKVTSLSKPHDETCLVKEDMKPRT